jgi:hypothetical protein
MNTLQDRLRMLGASHDCDALMHEAADELDRLFAENEALRKALDRIAALDPSVDSDQGWNEWGEADCFDKAQEIAKAALK